MRLLSAALLSTAVLLGCDTGDQRTPLPERDPYGYGYGWGGDSWTEPSCDDVSTVPQGTGTAPDCAGFEGLATTAELEATPRADPWLELLVMQMAGGFTADQVTYERVSIDLDAIRSSAPELAGVAPIPRHDGQTLLLAPERATFEAMTGGSYTAWNCLNARYGLSGTDPNDFSCHPHLALRFEGTYDMEALAAEYALLPGVRGAIANYVLGGGSSRVCGVVEASTFHYLVLAGSGDCESGCMEMEAFWFSTEPGAAPVQQGRWSSVTDTEPPTWAARFESCP